MQGLTHDLAFNFGHQLARRARRSHDKELWERRGIRMGRGKGKEKGRACRRATIPGPYGGEDDDLFSG